MAPINDNFVNAIELTGTSDSMQGTTIDATNETNDPIDWWEGWGDNQSVWYKYTPLTDGFLTVLTRPPISGPDITYTIVISMDANDPMRVDSKAYHWGAPDDPDNFTGYGYVKFFTEYGKTYYIEVDGGNATPGNFTISWEFVAANNDGVGGGRDELDLSSHTTISAKPAANSAGTDSYNGQYFGGCETDDGAWWLCGGQGNHQEVLRYNGTWTQWFMPITATFFQNIQIATDGTNLFVAGIEENHASTGYGPFYKIRIRKYNPGTNTWDSIGTVDPTLYPDQGALGGPVIQHFQGLFSYFLMACDPSDPGNVYICAGEHGRTTDGGSTYRYRTFVQGFGSSPSFSTPTNFLTQDLAAGSNPDTPSIKTQWCFRMDSGTPIIVYPNTPLTTDNTVNIRNTSGLIAQFDVTDFPIPNTYVLKDTFATNVYSSSKRLLLTHWKTGSAAGGFFHPIMEIADDYSGSLSPFDNTDTHAFNHGNPGSPETSRNFAETTGVGTKVVAVETNNFWLLTPQQLLQFDRRCTNEWLYSPVPIFTQNTERILPMWPGLIKKVSADTFRYWGYFGGLANALGVHEIDIARGAVACAPPVMSDPATLPGLHAVYHNGAWHILPAMPI